MAIKLITGKPGSFKSAYLMQLALSEISQGRLVYFCNFRGLQASKYQLNTLDHFNEWSTVPDGSLVIIDEVQEFTRDVPTNAKTEELPSWMTLLEKHRHRGIDIYVVTQHPMFIHTHIRRLLELHIHMQRVQGLPFSNRREWQQVCSDPENLDNASIKKGCTTTIYRPDKKVFQYYESTVVDTHKFKIPSKLIRYILILIAVFSFVYWLGSPVFTKYMNYASGASASSDSPSSDSPSSDSPSSDPLVLSASSYSPEQQLMINISMCIDQFNLTKDQCSELLDPNFLKARNDELLISGNNILIDYDPNDPYKTFDSSYQSTTQPIFSGCIRFDGKYYAYSQQGTLLDSSVCHRLIEKGDRPFNYFADSSVPSDSSTFGNSPIMW